MTEKSQRQDREDAREERETSSTEMSAEVAEERAAQNNLNVDMPSEGGETQGATESPRPRARRASRKAASTPAQEPLSVSPLEADAMELEAQGFSSDEAQRLIDVSKRLESSAEARASQAELKRLRFTQWLIEHGILDEFSV